MKYLYTKKWVGDPVNALVDIPRPIYYSDESSSGDIIWRPPTSSGGDDGLDRCELIDRTVDIEVDPQTGLKKKSKPKPKPQLP